MADVRLVRADKMNALDDGCSRRCASRRAPEAHARRAPVLLSGEGRAFCAGLDTANFGRRPPGQRGGERLLERAHGGRANPPQHTVMVWRELPVPVIAAVHGVAYGGGSSRMLAADLRFVAPDTRLSIRGDQQGLVPDMGGMALLRGLVRDDIARELTYTGRVFDGREAAQLAWPRALAPTRMPTRWRWREIAARPPKAMRAAKRLLELVQHADTRPSLLAETASRRRDRRARTGGSGDRPLAEAAGGVRRLSLSSRPRGSAGVCPGRLACLRPGRRWPR